MIMGTGVIVMDMGRGVRVGLWGVSVQMQLLGVPVGGGFRVTCFNEVPSNDPA